MANCTCRQVSGRGQQWHWGQSGGQRPRPLSPALIQCKLNTGATQKKLRQIDTKTSFKSLEFWARLLRKNRIYLDPDPTTYWIRIRLQGQTTRPTPKNPSIYIKRTKKRIRILSSTKNIFRSDPQKLDPNPTKNWIKIQLHGANDLNCSYINEFNL